MCGNVSLDPNDLLGDKGTSGRALFEDIVGEEGNRIKAFDLSKTFGREKAAYKELFRRPFSRGSAEYIMSGGTSGRHTPTEDEYRELSEKEQQSRTQRDKAAEKREQEAKSKLEREERIKAKKRRGRGFFTQGSLRGQINSGTSPLFDSAFGN